MKNYIELQYGPLKPNKVLTGPWEIITIDLIVYLPESNSYNSIYIVVDCLTKCAHFFAITDEFLAKNLARLLYNQIYPIHSLLKQIISDREI